MNRVLLKKKKIITLWYHRNISVIKDVSKVS